LGGMKPLWRAILMGALLGASSAMAGAPEDGSASSTDSSSAVQRPAGSAKSPRTVLHFGEDDIRGDITRPDGELVQAPRRVSESSLLRVRRSFVDRALASVARGQ
jgi:hypothetical protein